MKKLTRYYIDKGIRSLYVCGSTGEGFLLDQSERKKIVETVLEESQDGLSIIVHVGCPSTRHSYELAKHAYDVDAHDLLLFHVSTIDQVKKVYIHIGLK